MAPGAKGDVVSMMQVVVVPESPSVVEERFIKGPVRLRSASSASLRKMIMRRGSVAGALGFVAIDQTSTSCHLLCQNGPVWNEWNTRDMA